MSMKINSLFVFVVVFLLFAVTSFAQQNISPDKKVLIQELRQLTESATLSISVDLTKINIQEIYTAQIEKDPELTDSQKQELKKFIVETKERVDGEIKSYFADKLLMKQITDEAGFQVYDKSFAEDELKELIAFYKTPTGQKAIKFMPSVRTQLGKAFGQIFDRKIQEFVKPKMQVAVDELQKKIQEFKGKKSEN